MPETERLTTEQREMELALAGLTPHAPQRDPASLMFELGQRAERRRCRRWQAGTGGLSLLLAASLSVHLLWTTAPPPDASTLADHDEPALQVAEHKRENMTSMPGASASVEAEQDRSEAAAPLVWSWRVEPRPGSAASRSDHRQTAGYLSRLVREHGIDALPEPGLRFPADPADLTSPL